MKKLKIKKFLKRFVVFFIILLTFLVSLFAVLYGFGYRVNFYVNKTLKTFDFKVYQSGSLKIKIEDEKNLSLFINDKKQKSFYVQTIKPGIYFAKISGDEILDYKFSFQIKSGELTKIEINRLFLSNPKFYETVKNFDEKLYIEGVFVSPNEKNIIVKTDDRVIVFDENLNKKSENLGGQIREIFVSRENVFLIEKDVFKKTKKDPCRGYILEENKFVRKIESEIFDNFFCKFFINNEKFENINEKILNYQIENGIQNFKIPLSVNFNNEIFKNFYSFHPLDENKIYINLGINYIFNQNKNLFYQYINSKKLLTVKDGNSLKNYGIFGNSIKQIFSDYRKEDIFVNSSKILDFVIDPNLKYVYVLDENGKIFAISTETNSTFLVFSLNEKIFENSFLSISTNEPTKLILISQNEKNLNLKKIEIFAKSKKSFMII
ncbi:MAG: hypothetical protein Fur0024_1610 [Patescibacteria group bacterium]